MRNYVSIYPTATHSLDVNTKIRLAEQGIFLDILLNDESSYVREAVARQKYRLDVLMYDDDEDVRAVVAELGLLRCPHCGSRIIGTRSRTK